MKHEITLTVNGLRRTLWADSADTLLRVLREVLFLTGTKKGCGEGECGSCTVIMNGVTVRSCLVLAVEADGAEIVTIEGIARDGELSEVQRAFVDADAVQCGFCSPGFVMALEGVLRKNPDASREELLAALGGHLCRCTGYEAIIRAVDLIVRNRRRNTTRRPPALASQGS